MAKIRLNTALTSIRGRVGDLIFKQYSYGTVVTPVPRMKDVKWSAAQKAQRQRGREAGVFYRTVLADPVLLKKFKAIAARKKIPLSSATFEHFMRTTAKAPAGAEPKAK